MTNGIKPASAFELQQMGTFGPAVMERHVKGLRLGLMVACLAAGQALGAESAADAIKAFGLIGTWSVDCARDPLAACDRTTGCGFRVTYLLSPSGQPMIRSVVGTLVAGQTRTGELTIETARRITDDRLAVTSIQRTESGATLAWVRQPGEIWDAVLLKEGDKYRVFMAQRDDGLKISVEDGFEVRVPPGTRADALPDHWVRSDKATSWFSRCGD
jgi:hypothetical protein